VLIPGENEKDLADIPDNVKKGMQITPVATVDELLKHALVGPLTAIEWPEDKGEKDTSVLPAGTGAERPGIRH
jgi:ATP-dependent Lon protease